MLLLLFLCGPLSHLAAHDPAIFSTLLLLSCFLLLFSLSSPPPFSFCLTPLPCVDATSIRIRQHTSPHWNQQAHRKANCHTTPRARDSTSGLNRLIWILDLCCLLPPSLDLTNVINDAIRGAPNGLNGRATDSPNKTTSDNLQRPIEKKRTIRNRLAGRRVSRLESFFAQQ